MHRTLHPPGPHLFGGERQERCEQTVQGRQRESESRPRRSGSRQTLRTDLHAGRSAVRPALDELQVVVTEAPEELLGALESAGVVEVLERVRCVRDEPCERRHHRQVERLGDRRGVDRSRIRDDRPVLAGGRSEGQCELRRVQQLDRQTSADLHLRLVEGRVGSGAGGRGPVADAVRAVRIEKVRRHDHVALGLRHLLAVRVEDPPGQRCSGPRHRAVLVMAAQHRREQPGADDVVALGSHVHREGTAEQVRVLTPPGGDLRGQRRRRPRVHDVGVADEPSGNTTLVFGESRSGVGLGIDGQGALVGDDRILVIGLTVRIQAVPERERHAEVPLTRHEPVAVQATDPVVVAVAHVVRVPDQFVPACQQFGLEFLGPPTVADVPLA